MRRVLIFALPCALWLFLMRDFIFGVIPLNMDTNTIYGAAKYYFNNLLNGVVPLWDPFVSLGRPFYALPICNLFNPITQLIPLLKLAGVNYYAGFIIYMAAYFLIGCLGFYFLAKEVLISLWPMADQPLLKDKHLAAVAFLALLFSSFGVSMFTQLTFLELVVPTIWFFFFLARFAHRQTRGHFLGLSFTAMVLASSYLPFYFLTVWFVVMLFLIPFYWAQAKSFCVNFGVFALKHGRLCLLCCIGILLAAAPLIIYKIMDASGDVVAPGRHCQYASAQECYERTMRQQGGMLYDEITRSGSLGERLDIGYLFAHLDQLTYGSDSLFFLPVMIYLILFLGILTKADRLSFLLAGVAAVLGLIALGDAAGLHPWLYNHAPFFRYFRNLFFFGAFLLPVAILLAVKNLQALLSIQPRAMAVKKGMITGMVVLHGIAALFLKQFNGVLPTAWLTLAASLVVFVLYYGGLWRWGGRAWAWIFAGILLIQPADVMAHYAANALEFRCSLPSAHVNPVFQWVRPQQAQAGQCRIYQFVHYEDFWYAMNMTDAPPKVGHPQSAARWTFDLSQRVDEEALGEYARNKIVVYDTPHGAGQPVLGDTPQVKVEHFDVNRLVLRTNFTRNEYLVYNDSFTNAWRAYVNGRPQPLQRAGEAFKGLWVPPGECLVEFSYEPVGGGWVYLAAMAGLLAFFVGAGIVLAGEYGRQRV